MLRRDRRIEFLLCGRKPQVVLERYCSEVTVAETRLLPKMVASLQAGVLSVKRPHIAVIGCSEFGVN